MIQTIRRTLPTLGLALAVAAHAAAAQQSRPVTLDEALRLFAENSLDLRLARAMADEATALARQAGAWPNPTVTGTHESLTDGDLDVSESYINLSQRLEWPGTRGARREAAERAASAARIRFRADSARLAFEVKEAYTRAQRTQRAVAVLTTVTAVFREGLASAEERFAAGDISLYDRRRIEVERARYETRLAEAELVAAAARRELALLVAPDGEALELAPADPLQGAPPSVEAGAALARALERRPEVEAAEEAVAAARAEASVARRGRIPDLTATGGYKRQSDGLDGLFVGLSLPLPLWNRSAGAIAVATSRATAAESRATLVRRQVSNDVRRALERYRSLATRAELLGDGDAAAEAHLESHLAEARLRADFWTSYYDLERAVAGFGGPGTDSEDDR